MPLRMAAPRLSVNVRAKICPPESAVTWRQITDRSTVDLLHPLLFVVPNDLLYDFGLILVVLGLNPRYVAAGKKVARFGNVVPEAVTGVGNSHARVEVWSDKVGYPCAVNFIGECLRLARVAYLKQILEFPSVIFDLVSVAFDGLGRLQPLAAGIDQHFQHFVARRDGPLRVTRIDAGKRLKMVGRMEPAFAALQFIDQLDQPNALWVILGVHPAHDRFRDGIPALPQMLRYLDVEGDYCAVNCLTDTLVIVSALRCLVDQTNLDQPHLRSPSLQGLLRSTITGRRCHHTCRPSGLLRNNQLASGIA